MVIVGLCSQYDDFMLKIILPLNIDLLSMYMYTFAYMQIYIHSVCVNIYIHIPNIAIKTKAVTDASLKVRQRTACFLIDFPE